MNYVYSTGKTYASARMGSAFECVRVYVCACVCVCVGDAGLLQAGVAHFTGCAEYLRVYLRGGVISKFRWGYTLGARGGRPISVGNWDAGCGVASVAWGRSLGGYMCLLSG